MTRRRALWLTGIASVVLLGVEAAFDVRMQDAGGHGIIDFEIAGSLAHSRRILEFWGHDGHEAARFSLWFDYLFLIAYGAFWALAVASVRDMARRLGWRRFARVGAVLVAFPIAAAAFDAIEDVGLLLALGRHGGALAPRLASVCATAKFILIEIAILFVIVAIVRRALERWPVPTIAGLVVVLVAVMALVADGIVVTNRTRAAEASAGTIVREPGGDIHVSDQGPRSTSAIVLLHGWASSMNWWEAAARPISHRFRVIRVDLLGFGASSKPASGYSMERQARLVLGALNQLGVKRAVVVGHSMGGAVAVSMAQQDRSRVTGVAVVDTPPRNDAGAETVSDRLVRIPLVGAALFDITPDSVLRAQLRAGFARGYKVPAQFVADLNRVTFTSLTDSGKAFHDYISAHPLDERMRSTDKPLLVIYGRGDRLVDPSVASAWFVPRRRVVSVAGAGHSPQVERPAFTAALIERFARPLLR